MELEPATRWWEEESQREEPICAEPWAKGRKGVVHDRDCVVGAWCMGWLGEDKVRQEARMIMESLGGHGEEVVFISGALGGGWKWLGAWSSDTTPLWLKHPRMCRSQGQGHEAWQVESWQGRVASSITLHSSSLCRQVQALGIHQVFSSP